MSQTTPGMIAVARFRVPEDAGIEFAERAGVALQVFASRPGFAGGELGRSADDATLWALVTRWVGVGAYRRALSSYDVKVSAVPLLSQALDEPGAFETVLAGAAAGSQPSPPVESRRAADADVIGVGRAAAAHVPTTLGFPEGNRP